MAGPTRIGGLVRAVLVGLVPLLAGCDAAGTPAGRLADTIPVDGHPFAVAPLDDGTLLVSLSYGDDRGGAIAVLQPVAARFAVRETIPVAGRPASIAVSHGPLRAPPLTVVYAVVVFTIVVQGLTIERVARRLYPAASLG